MYLVCIDFLRFVAVALIFASIVVTSLQYAQTTGDDATQVILSVTEDQAEAFATATLRSAVAGHIQFSNYLVHKSCRFLEGQPMAAYTPFFSNDRAFLGVYTQAAYEFYLVTPRRVNPYDPSSFQWNSCGCLSLDNVCYIDINNTMTRATYSKYDGWGSSSGGNISLLHPRSYIMSNFSNLVAQLTRAVPVRWGAKTLLVLDNASSNGRGNLPLVLLPHAVCVEWNSTDGCVRAHIIEVRIDSILGEALREGATSSTGNNFVGLYDVTHNERLTALSPIGDSSNDTSMLDMALSNFMALCTPGPGNFSARCPSRKIEQNGAYVSSATLIKIGQVDDFSLVIVEITPLSEYYGQMHDLKALGIGFGAGAVLLVIIFFIINAFCVAASFRRLARHVRHLATISPDSLEESGVVESVTLLIPELHELHETFVALRNRVRHLRRFIPQGVLDDPIEYTSRAHRSGALDAAARDADVEDSLSASSATAPEFIMTGGSSSTDKRILMLHTHLPRVTGVAEFTKQVSLKNLHKNVAVTSAAARRTGMMLGPNRYITRTGTILVIGIAIPASIDQEELEGMLSHIMDEIITATTEHGGTIEVLRPEQIIVCFNVEGRHSQAWMHATAASNCALDIMESLPEYLRTMVVCALDSGEYWVGSCGSHARLSRALFGARLQTCHQLAYLASVALGSKIVLSDRTAAFLSAQRLTFPVDSVSFASGDLQGTKLLVHELPLPSLVEQQPALLLQKNKSLYRDAFSALMDGRLPEAQAMLRLITCPPFATHAKRLLVYMDVLMRVVTQSTTQGCAPSALASSSRTSMCNTSGVGAYVRPQTPSWDMFGTSRHHRSSSIVTMLQSFETVDIIAPKMRQLQQGLSHRPPSSDDKESTVHSNTGSLRGSASLIKRAPSTGTTPVLRPEATPTDLSSATTMQSGVKLDLAQRHAQAQSSTATIIAVDPPLVFQDADGVLWHRADDACGHSAAHTSQLYVVVSSATGAVLCAKALWLGSQTSALESGEGGESDITATRRTALSRRHLHLTMQAISATMELQAGHTHENLVRSYPVVPVSSAAADGTADAEESFAQWTVYLCDFMSLGSVLDLQRKFGFIPLSAVRRRASDIIHGLQYLHSLSHVYEEDGDRLDEGEQVPALPASHPMDMLLGTEVVPAFPTSPATPPAASTGAARILVPHVHGNLRSCNVLVGSDGTCKLSDYGAHFMMETFLHRLWGKLQTAAEEHTGSIRYGAFRDRPIVAYAAPELLAPFVTGTWVAGDSHAALVSTTAAPLTTPASDVFSFGVVLYEIVTKSLPWSRADVNGAMTPVSDNAIRNDAMALQLRVASMKRALEPDSQPWPTPCTTYVDAALVDSCIGANVASGSKEHIVDMITSCLRSDPMERPTTTMLAQHPLFLMW